MCPLPVVSSAITTLPAASRRMSPSLVSSAASVSWLFAPADQPVQMTSPGPSRAPSGSGAWTIRYSDG
jgi:hypothetical protein